MAQVLGEAGRYVHDTFTRKRRQFFLTAFLGGSVLSAGLGFMIGLWVPAHRIPTGVFVVLGICALVGIYILDRVVTKRMDQLEREQWAYRKGARGESRIGEVLAELPAEYHVINGLTTPFGDLDHVVVGPTGVFVIDAKNWKGIVEPDGRGELLLNRRPTDRPTVKPLVARTMNVKEKVQTLCGFEPPYFQVVLAFPSARVEALWGTTGPARCVSDEALRRCIEDHKASKSLTSQQVDALAQAFLGLATMDKEFHSRRMA